mgnify:CR=1 FL=1
MAVDSNTSGSVRFSYVLHILIDTFEMTEDEKNLLISVNRAGLRRITRPFDRFGTLDPWTDIL